MTTPCRNCKSTAERQIFCDLGNQPLANAYLTKEDLDRPEVHFPLRPTICEECGLIQLPNLEAPETIFTDYAYFSSQSREWLTHVGLYARDMVAQLGLDRTSSVLEVASNDGATLRAFRSYGIPAFGVEPAENIAVKAQMAGLSTIPAFMGVELAQDLLDNGYQGADLIHAANVMAHVPDLDDFLGGIRMLMKPMGTFTVEFPNATILIQDNQFDQIYHEHFSYFNTNTAVDVLARRGLIVHKVQLLDIHGGSVRLEATAGDSYSLNYFTPDEEALNYHDRPNDYRRQFLDKLIHWKQEGKRIVGYGAPAKGSTMLNYCGIDSDTIEYVVDSTPAKQGKFLPGSRIPIYAPEHLDADDPDVIIILPHNWRKEIAAKLTKHKARGAIILSRLEEV